MLGRCLKHNGYHYHYFFALLCWARNAGRGFGRRR
jgi:hypothetical protein